MGYAPLSNIVNVPVPADSGTTLTVQADAGDRFPKPPFTYLIWSTQEIPQDGVNSETGTCTAIELDTLTLVRPDNAIAVTSGMQIAATETQPRLSRGENIVLSQLLLPDATGVVLTIRKPSGYLVTETDLDTTGEDGGTAYSLDFVPDESGQWFYGFATDGGTVTPESDFYVRYSEVL